VRQAAGSWLEQHKQRFYLRDLHFKTELTVAGALRLIESDEGG
jgi:hypothetical protein